MKILDCSIRDGGHLNRWRFQPSLAVDTYKAARDAGVSICEIGYRYPTTMEGLGYFGYSLDSNLAILLEGELSPDCKLGVMIDTGKCETRQFMDKEDSPISVVRVAAYPYELEKALWQVEELVDKGYLVFLNPMASSELTKDDFALLRDWKHKDWIEAVYFADSFGTFTPADVNDHLNKFHDAGFPSVGFHAHNNLQMAVANTLEAVKCGATWVDATAFGIGRGAGNAPIEIVLGLLNRQGYNFNIFPYLELAHNEFERLYRELNWALRPQTVMGGLKNVHPYYMEDLFNRDLPLDTVWNLLDTIKSKCPISYSKTAVANLLEDIGPEGVENDGS